MFYNDYYRTVTGINATVKKLMDSLTVKHIYFLVKGKARLTSEEFEAIKDLKLFDLIIETAFNMLIGDGAYTPDSPEYKVLMPLCAMLDSIINTQPFVNAKDKLLGGYSVPDIIEPMLFNNSVPDREGSIYLNEIPALRMETPAYKSHAGAILMGIIYVFLLLLSPLAPIAIAIGLPVLTVKKRKKAKKHQEPFYRYS